MAEQHDNGLQPRDADLAAEDWIVSDAGRDLVHLRFRDMSDGFFYHNYIPVFVGITEEEWAHAYSIDSRDVPWHFRRPRGGATLPFCRMTVTWVPSENRVSLKCSFSIYQTVSTDWWSRFKARIGFGVVPVPQERAPVSWDRLNMRSVRRNLASGDRNEVADALEGIRAHCISLPAPWASDIFLAHCEHPDSYVRLASAAGLGELARVHGYADEERAVASLKRVMEGASVGLHRVALKSLDEIQRFARPGKRVDLENGSGINSEARDLENGSGINSEARGLFCHVNGPYS
ncbi:MAG: hypothetical protein ACHRHE_11165, partial [Tepidisphaerales bacterium]